jgi:hypothetical protein
LRTPAAELAVSLHLTPAAVDRKLVALRAQASQTAGLFSALGEDRVRRWWSSESFIAAESAAVRRGEWGTFRVV